MLIAATLEEAIAIILSISSITHVIAAGFIATELIKQLLEKGYDVIATVRDPESAKAEYLQKLGAAFPGSLELVQGDITTPGVFDEAIKKVQYVFHTA